MSASAFPVTRRRIAVPGLTLAADVAGPEQGQPVVLIPGGGQTRHSWRRALVDFAAAGLNVTSIDLRGHGESDWASDGDYGIDRMTADLAGVVSGLARPPVLVGASIGGVCSLLLLGDAARQGLAPPARALVLVDVAPRIELEGADQVRSFMGRHAGGFATLDEVADAVAAYNPNRPRPRDVEGLRRNLRQGADGRLYWHWDPRFLEHGSRPGAMETMLDRLAASAEAIRVPVLLVRGLQSEIVNDEGVADLKRRIPHARVCDIAGAGHMVAGDKNDVFDRAVLDFVLGLDG